MIRMLIVDDHSHFRGQLKKFLESVDDWHVCGEAANGWEAIEIHGAIQPHVTIMDFNMPELNGLYASRAILRKCPEAAILMLTVFASSELAVQARKEGIKVSVQKLRLPALLLPLNRCSKARTISRSPSPLPPGIDSVVHQTKDKIV